MLIGFLLPGGDELKKLRKREQRILERLQEARKAQARALERFQRAQADLHTTVNLDVFDMLLGSTVEVTAIDGRTIALTVPANFTPTQKLRVPGQGMNRLGGQGRGDLYVSIQPSYPVLSEAQRAKLAAVRATP